MSAEQENICIKGARANNLKNFDLEIPRGKLVVITGISGSGKSSLAFDTLFAEGERRFAESISSFARQFLGRMTKPAVDSITGIPPAIAVQQKVNTTNSRSTIATATGIYDYLRLLYAKIGRTYSPVSGKEVTCDTAKSVYRHILTLPEGAKLILAARLDLTAENAVERLLELKQEGFVRLCAGDGSYWKIDEILSKESTPPIETLMLLVDRFSAADDEETEARCLDSAQTAFIQGKGHMAVICNGRCEEFSNIFEADGILFEKPDENLFSYNSPIGACPTCGGFGKVMGIDESLVIPDPTKTIFEGAVACWRGEMMKARLDEVVENAYKCGLPIHTPYNLLTKEQKQMLWKGTEFFNGIDQFFEWVTANRYKIQYKYMLNRYSGKTVCPECEGSRLRKEALYVKIGGQSIADLLKMSISDIIQFFRELKLDEYDATVAERPLKEIMQRLEYIDEVGLSYLTLDRAANTLSGGESQRINLVCSLGNNLVGSLYILDEPSIGLHTRDTERLIGVLKRLRDLGNTVIVVEHDPDIIRAADHLIDVGPFAGAFGGEIVYEGEPDGNAEENPRSLTLKYLTHDASTEERGTPRPWSKSIEVAGAVQNNLKNIDVKFPLGCLTAVTGVSGSGKSSLVGDILYPALYRHINQFGEKPGLFKELRGDLRHISEVQYVDQNPIGKSSRSNPVTYLKVYDDIRKLFSEQPYAKLNGYGHSHFSFNIDGGRCPECQGEGVIRIEMQFMADVTMVCESCGGKRFLPDILEVRYHGKNIYDVLEMRVDEAIEFFSTKDDPYAQRIAERLEPLRSVGLSYLKLGQSSSTLSGGESQRIKLASFLGKEKANGRILFIFDEPTTGLHFFDIEKLLNAFDSLIEKGHSIIVVEHNLDIIKAADWVIELGPEAGVGGGKLIFEGTPKTLAAHPEFPTGRALAQYFKK